MYSYSRHVHDIRRVQILLMLASTALAPGVAWAQTASQVSGGGGHNAIDPQDNSPQMVWDKFISRHEQIFLVLCGHAEGQAFRVDDNQAGGKVYQVMSDYQGRAQTVRDAGTPPALFVGVGDGWLRLMDFDMARDVPSIHVHTYSTHYKVESRAAPDYAKWYKAGEKPKMTDAEFHAQDDFRIELTDFRARFGAPAK